jgi:hypothetical protein
MKFGKIFVGIFIINLAFISVYGRAKKQQSKVKLMKLDEIKPGMEGYGLTIVRDGTKIEKFKVKIIGVMKNFIPGMDIIIARGSGLSLEKSGIVAGMSGSPIYIGNKLIGALAYGFLYSKEPIMGITPIKYMLSEKRRGLRLAFNKAFLNKRNERRIVFPYDFKKERWMIVKRLAKGDDIRGIVPVSLLWMASGFESEVIRKMKKEMGLGNIVAGGSEILSKEELKEVLKPGGAIAVKIIGGDIDFSGVGTITYKDGNKIIAFGHPMRGYGKVNFLLSAAKVYTVVSSYKNSFKLASACQDVGRLVYDGIAGIYGILGKTPKTVPIDVFIKDNKFKKKLHFYTVFQKNFSFPLIVYATYNFPMRYVHLLEDREIKHTIKIFFEDGKEFTLSDYSVNADFNTLVRLYTPVYFILQNPIGWYPIKKIEYYMNVGEKYPTAYITRVYFSKTKVKAGEKIYIYVELKPYNKPKVLVKIPFKIPEDYEGVYMRIKITSGDKADINKPMPTNFEELLSFYSSSMTAKDIVIEYIKPRLSLFYNGRAFYDIIPNVAMLLKQKFYFSFSQPNVPYTLRSDTYQEEIGYITKRTKYIIKGERYLFLKVE